MKDNIVLIHYESKTKYTWINLELIWVDFQSGLNLNEFETKELMNSMIKRHLKLVTIESGWFFW